MIVIIILIIILIICLYFFHNRRQIILNNTKNIDDIQNNNDNNQTFIKLYNQYKNIDVELLNQYKKGIINLEDINFKHSYTPKKLLDDRIIIHIDLDNEDYKDGLGL